MDDLERLKELAEKATPGPWAHVPDDDIPGQREPDMVRIAGAYWQQQSGGLTYNSTVASANAAYIAAANPEAVLKLIARVRELEANQRTPGTVEVCKQCHRPLPDAMVISMRKGCSGDCPLRSVSPSP